MLEMEDLECKEMQTVYSLNQVQDDCLNKCIVYLPFYADVSTLHLCQ